MSDLDRMREAVDRLAEAIRLVAIRSAREIGTRDAKTAVKLTEAAQAAIGAADE